MGVVSPHYLQTRSVIVCDPVAGKALFDGSGLFFGVPDKTHATS